MPPRKTKLKEPAKGPVRRLVRPVIRAPGVLRGYPGGYGPKPKKPSPEDQQWLIYLQAESTQESGGNWTAVSPDGALGRWQVMPANLGPWANQCGLPVVSPDYYLSNDNYQLQLVTCILKPIFETHGPAEAAAWWYSGQFDATATFGDPPVYEYVESVLHLMGAGLPFGLTGHQEVGNYYGLPGIPPVGNDSWAHTIDSAGVRFRNISATMHVHSGNIDALLARREEH